MTFDPCKCGVQGLFAHEMTHGLALVDDEDDNTLVSTSALFPCEHLLLVLNSSASKSLQVLQLRAIAQVDN